MAFSEFDSEFFEAARSPAPRSTAGGAPRTAPRAGGARTAPAPRSSSAPTSRGPAGRAPAPRGRAAAPGARAPAPQRGPARPPGGAPSGRPSGGGLSSFASTLSRIPSYAQQAFDFAQAGVQGVQAAQQFLASLGIGGARPAGGQPAAAAPPGAAAQPPGVDAGAAGPAVAPLPTPPPAAAPMPGPDAGAVPQPQPQPQPYPTGLQPMASGDLGMLLQALQQRQIPPLPSPAAQPAPAFPGAQPQPDALGLLRVILTNPHLQQALQSAPMTAAAAPPAVQLPVPAVAPPHQTRPVRLPLAAVLNAIVGLSGQTMTELNESTSEEDPEIPSYLLDDNGDFLVDPASADDRAALVAHLFRLSDEAQRSGYVAQPTYQSTYESTYQSPEADGELDESDEWANEAGFIK